MNVYLKHMALFTYDNDISLPVNMKDNITNLLLDNDHFTLVDQKV